MIVVDPDEIVWSRIADDLVSKPFVYLFISVPVFWLEITKILQIVKQRPDHLVGITVVELIPLSLTEGHRHDVVTGIAGGFGQRLFRDFARNTGPTDPCAATLAQHRLNCRNQSARSRCDCPKVF